MPTLREWVTRLRATLRPGRRDSDLEEELRLHLELAADDERRRTGSAENARRAAAIRSGGLAQAMESLREQRGLPSLDNLRRDVYYAWRAITRKPGFTVLATITLGAALALCLTVVTLVNAYVIRALPYPAADRLHSLVLRSAGSDLPRRLVDLDWTALDDMVEHRIAWDLDMFYLLGGAYPEKAPGAWVTPGFVQAFGLRAERGRVLESTDFIQGGPTSVMISHRLWISRFASDPDVVGRTLKAYVSDRPDEPETLTVVGVLPADFWHFNTYTDVFGPLRASSYPYLLELRAGVDASAVAERVTALVRTTDPTLSETWRAAVVPLQARYVEEMRPLLTAVAVSAGLVLLIACANLTVLLLVRSARRRHEMAIRLALGASRARLARLLGLEGLLLAGTATALGLGASAILARLLAPVVEQRLGRRLPGGEAALGVDGTLLAAALVGAVFLTLALTVAPLITLSSTAAPALKTGGRGATEGRTARRLRSVLIACEIAASLALLAGSVLMIQSSTRMLRADPGFRAAGVLTTSVGLRARAHPDAAGRAEFFTRLLRRLEERTGGGSAALSNAWPLQSALRTRVASASDNATVAEAGVVKVSAEYFATLGMRFRDGASFAAQDRIGAEAVVVVSESLARRFWPRTRAVGQHLRISEAGDDAVATAITAAPPHLVVGVVEDVQQVQYDDGQVKPDASQLDAYLPMLQNPGRFAFVFTRQFAGAPDRLRLEIAELDREAAVEPPESLASALNEARSGPRQLALMLSGFAAFAALLALLGVYSVIAYAVRQREREIGIRLVVGAHPRAITRLFMREGTPLVACGLVAGIFGAAALGQVLRSQLFGVAPVEPVMFAATTVMFALCAWMALWWPARRAAVIDPAQVLKDE